MLKIIIFIIIAFLNSNSLKAEDFYAVDNIVVDIVSEKIGQARQKATNDAILIGFKRLLSWKLNREDFYIIEDIVKKNSEPSNIKDYITGYKIHHEKFSNFNYRAEFSIYYDLEKIKNWLIQYNISYYDKNITNILTVPIMGLDKHRFLWDGPNIWAELWQNSRHNKYINNFIFPDGDIDDVSILSYEDLYNLNLSKINNFSDKYKLNNVLIPFLYLNTNNDQIFKAEFGVNLIVNKKLVNITEKQNLTSFQDESLEDFVIRCKNIISDTIINYFDKNNTVKNVSLKVTAKYKDFENWLILKSSISKIKEIIKFDILSLTINEAIIEIEISINSETDLFNIFNNSRLEINKNHHNEYDISVIFEDDIYNDENNINTEKVDDRETILVIE